MCDFWQGQLAKGCRHEGLENTGYLMATIEGGEMQNGGRETTMKVQVVGDGWSTRRACQNVIRLARLLISALTLHNHDGTGRRDGRWGAYDVPEAVPTHIRRSRFLREGSSILRNITDASSDLSPGKLILF